MAGYLPFSIGNLQCAAVSAGTGRFRVQAFFANVPTEILDPVLAGYGIQSNTIDTPFNCLLIHHPDALILVDTGPKAKTLVKNLSQQGIGVEDIDMVVLSHGHPDHTGGALNEHGQPTFPAARYIASATEPYVMFQRLEDLPLDFIKPGNELMAGICTLAAPGHTPGQMTLRIESQGETLVYTSDVIAHPLHVSHAGWNIVSDANRPQALLTRENLLQQAADAGWWLFVYHFPFPGLCRIARKGNTWRIVEQRSIDGT